MLSELAEPLQLLPHHLQILELIQVLHVLHLLAGAVEGSQEIQPQQQHLDSMVGQVVVEKETIILPLADKEILPQ